MTSPAAPTTSRSASLRWVEQLSRMIMLRGDELVCGLTTERVRRALYADIPTATSRPAQESAHQLLRAYDVQRTNQHTLMSALSRLHAYAQPTAQRDTYLVAYGSTTGTTHTASIRLSRTGDKLGVCRDHGQVTRREHEM